MTNDMIRTETEVEYFDFNSYNADSIIESMEMQKFFIEKVEDVTGSNESKVTFTRKTPRFKVGNKVFVVKGKYKGMSGTVTAVHNSFVEFKCDKTGMDMEDVHPSCLVCQGEKIDFYTTTVSTPITRVVRIGKFGPSVNIHGRKVFIELVDGKFRGYLGGIKR
ncbi:hypothetical protein EYB35_07260 [Bacillus paranthracis]|nr:hypothetical protein EYB35_07260 [Bacillus paranthracis]